MAVAPIASVGVGVVGAGDISRRYINCLQAMTPFEVRAVAGRTQVQSLLEDPGIELVLNLTPPLEHAAVTATALRAGKHVYSEKPLAHDLVAADDLISLARETRRTLACAPAVHLGPAQQAVKHAVDAGALGRLVGGSATVVYAGPDRWHHNPAPIFGPAAGPDGWWAVGVVDTANALRSAGESRCSTQVARHVLEVLTAIQISCETGGSIDVASRCQPPLALGTGSIEANFPALFSSPNQPQRASTSPAP